MKTFALLLGCLLAMASLAQSTQTRREVWQWVDENGVTHFSDQPTPGARLIVLVGSTPTATAPSTPAPSAAAASRTATPAKPVVEYRSLEIWEPASGESFFGADATVTVRLRSDPALVVGDRLLTYLDGKLLPGENAYEHTLTELVRGAHSLTAVIIDQKGNERIRSAPVVFHVRQPTTINNPRNQGPAVRPPPPRPQPRG